MFDEVRTVRVDAQNLADDEYLQRKFGVERDSDFPVLARK